MIISTSKIREITGITLLPFAILTYYQPVIFKGFDG